MKKRAKGTPYRVVRSKLRGLSNDMASVMAMAKPGPDIDFEDWVASLTERQEQFLLGTYTPSLFHRSRMIAAMRKKMRGPFTQAKRSWRLSTPERNKRKTECLRGHPLSGDNLQIRKDGRRRCIACTRPYGMKLSTPEKNKRKTECLRGHRLSGDNLRTLKDGRRQCISCARIRRRQ